MNQAEFPPYIQIETSFACNARCNMCVVHKAERAAFMSDELYDKILAELSGKAAEIRRVTIQFCGEPLLDKKLAYRIRSLKEAGIPAVYFGTNGSLLAPERCGAILESGVDQIDISVDGATAEVFEKIRLGLNYGEVSENIKTLIKMRDEGQYRTAIRLRYTIQKENVHEVDDFLGYWEPLLKSGDRAYAKYIHTFGGDKQLEELFPDKRPSDVNLDDRPCISPWQSFVILTDGRVVLCCNDYSGQYIMGDLNRESIAQVWNGEEFNNIRSKHAESGRKSIAICRGCTVWDDVSQLQ